jgi:hypothetical protein
MSRLAFACSLVVALSSAVFSTASANTVDASLDRAALRIKLVEQRAANLARFRAYQTAGVFPSNTYELGQLNVWRDRDGHFCAAATIIRNSGQTALVDQVATDNNFIRLADVKQGPLLDWILTSGLTQEEIVAIQRPFRPVSNRPHLEPATPVAVDPDLRTAETRRLAALYQQIDAQIVANATASLDLAVDRLMAHPDLSRRFSLAAN